MGENIRTGDIGNFPIKIIQVITQLPWTTTTDLLYF